MKRRFEKVGLYQISSPQEMSEDEFIEFTTTAPPNAQTAVLEWLERVEDCCKTICVNHPGTSHSYLASQILDTLDFRRARIERINEEADRYLALIEAMRLAEDVLRLNHNLALLKPVETQRKINQGDKKRRQISAQVRRKDPPRAEYDAARERAIAASPTKGYTRKRHAFELKVALPTLAAIEKRNNWKS